MHHWSVFQYINSVSRQRVNLNTLRLKQNGRHFADDTFQCISMNENVWIFIKTSLQFVPKGQTDNKSALIQVMACHCKGNKPLLEPMLTKIYADMAPLGHSELAHRVLKKWFSKQSPEKNVRNLDDILKYISLNEINTVFKICYVLR